MINENGVLDKVLRTIFNTELKAFNLLSVADDDVQPGEIGINTNVDEAMTLALDGETSKLRVSLGFSISAAATATADKPTPKAGSIVLWTDTTAHKYYILANFGTNDTPVVKQVELT